MYIDGVGITGYRSFGSEIQKIGPFEKINIIIGQNNSGKSNVLTFLTHYYKSFLNAISNSSGIGYTTIDWHLGRRSEEIHFVLGLKIGSDSYTAILDKYADCFSDPDSYKNLLERILKSNALTKGSNVAWFPYYASSPTTQLLLDPSISAQIESEDLFEMQKWETLWRTLTKGIGGRLENWIQETLEFLSPACLAPPNIEIIPAIRRVGEKGATTNDYSGIDLIERLAPLQNPRYNEQYKRQQFNDINEFFRKVVGNNTAQLEIPSDRDMISVHMDEKVLPLNRLGTGIQEVIILATAATVLRKQVLCIEEPELHLHPTLQKKLLGYLSEQTDNQYFITTHSAHILDTPDAAIFHVCYKESASRVKAVRTDTTRTLICADLGYRASDLLQANCIVWVEGPSDRIYIRHWLRSIAPDLLEGLHYSIMFYGGRLLSHLKADDSDVENFISLRRLNRYISIVIDSDRSKSEQDINETKRRVKEEFNQGPGFAWITQGREIENYVSSSLLEEAVKRVHRKVVRLASVGQFDHSLHYVTDTGEIKAEVDKVKVAHEVAKHPADLDILDLRQMLNKLVDFIRSSNNLDEHPYP